MNGVYLTKLREAIRREHVLVFLFALGIRLWFWNGVSGRPLVVKDAHRYIRWCGSLTQLSIPEAKSIVYLGYWLPYCGWLELTGGWVAGWIGIQLLLSALTCVLVYETARQFVSSRASLLAAGLFAVQIEVYKWAVRPQSEFMLTFAVALALWRLTLYHTDRSTRNRALVLASLALVATVRPNGLIIVMAYMVYDFFPRSSDRRLDLFFRARTNIAIAAVVGVLVAHRLSFGLYKGNTLLSPWKEGVIVTPDRFIYDYTPRAADGVLSFLLSNLDHVIAIAGLRALLFFSPVMPTWSQAHALRTGITLTPLTIGAILGIIFALRRNRTLLKLWGTTLLAVVVTAMLIWVAGWRNFLGPAAVVYALFTAYSVSILSTRLSADRTPPNDTAQ